MKDEEHTIVIKTISLDHKDDCQGCYYSTDSNTECSKETACELKLDREKKLCDIYVLSLKDVLNKL